MTKQKRTIALVGNPNVGKSMVFNQLTGLKQHVANYPGVTVEQKRGIRDYEQYEFEIIDLPGTYGLTTMSADEKVARDFIIQKRPDLIVNIIDSTNFERCMYLTLQLLELEVPVLVVANMYKSAQEQGIDLDTEVLSGLLNIPVVPAEAKTGWGIDVLLDRIVKSCEERSDRRQGMDYFDLSTSQQLEQVETILVEDKISYEALPLRWIAIKLLEDDSIVYEAVRNQRLDEKLAEATNRLHCDIGEDCQTMIAEGRYAFIAGLERKVISYKKVDRKDLTDAIDALLLHRYLGLPLFFLIMWAVFQITFKLGSLPAEWLFGFFSRLGSSIAGAISSDLLSSLIADGIIGGVGGVLTFIPQIAILFMVLAVLEDSGYLARAAYLMDEWMHRIGLHGRSFVPMILGFGCNVPAVMATRTLSTKKEKILTCLVVPFMSCSARLPVYALFISAFFAPNLSGTILFGLYLTGILSAIILVKIVGKYIKDEAPADFVLELPVYRLPTARSVFLYTWLKLKHYILKAGTVILIASALVWFISYYPREAVLESGITASYAGRIGRLLEPLVRPLGFDWRIALALVIGFSAKEIVVSTLATIYLTGNAELSQLSQVLAAESSFTPLAALSLMLFVLLYVPCLATVAVIKQEVGDRWMLVSILISTTWAWIVSFLVYQIGSILGF